jgi:ECF transporter S component (folate family)
MKLNVREITNAGLLTALSIVFTRLVAVIMIGSFVRLTFGTIPIYVAGLLFGPVVGGLVGGVADGLGFFVNSFGGAFIPHIFLASILRGVIPPLVVKVLGNNDRNWMFKVIGAIVVTELIASVWLTTAGLSWAFQTPFMANLMMRLPTLPIQLFIYCSLTYMFTVKLRSFASAYHVSK